MEMTNCINRLPLYLWSAIMVTITLNEIHDAVAILVGDCFIRQYDAAIPPIKEFMWCHEMRTAQKID